MVEFGKSCLHTFEYFQVLLFNTSSSVQLYSFICLHTVKWVQVLLSNTDNSIHHQPFVCSQLNGFKCRK